jgi:N-acetyl-D-muramate 6-phosphate phosphatase
VEPADAWYVGDNFDRDVLCGQRAGIGGNILMEASGTYDMPYQLTLKPGAIVANPRGLLRRFEQAVCGLVA